MINQTTPRGGYSCILRNSNDIETLTFQPIIKSILQDIRQSFEVMYGSSYEQVEPITCRCDSPDFKLRRSYSLDILSNHLSKWNLPLRRTTLGLSISKDGKPLMKISSGEGSRTNKAGGGVKGKQFEDDLAVDILNPSKFVVISEKIRSILHNDYQMNPNEVSVRVDGSKNQKRNMTFDGSRIIFDSMNIGSIVTDITIHDSIRTAYLSLKWSSSYYLLNASLRKYLHLDKPHQDIEERNHFLNYLGFCPSKFCDPYKLVSYDHSQNTMETTRRNWEQLVTDIMGCGYIYVVGGIDQPIVENFIEPPSIKVNFVKDVVYALHGVRKYSKIVLDCSINGHHYWLEAQLRGTTAQDEYPIYLRVLARKLER